MLDSSDKTKHLNFIGGGGAAVQSSMFTLTVSIFPPRSGGKLCKGESRIFYDLSPDHTHVAIVGLGPGEADLPSSEGEREDVDMGAQNVRAAAAVGTSLLRKAKVKKMLLDDFNNAEGTPSIMQDTPHLT